MGQNQKCIMDSSKRKYLIENKQSIISRYRFNQSLPIFIDEVKSFVKGEIYDDCFVHNSSEADYHIARFKQLKPFFWATIHFSDLFKFKESIRKTFPLLWIKPFLIRTERSEHCYMYRISSLDSFNWAFPFEVNEGILSLLSEDFLYEIILDWYEEDDVEMVDVLIKQ